MKTAIIYYSLSENCAFVAEEIKASLNSDVIRLRLKSEKKRNKVANFFWIVGVMLSKKPQLKPYTFDPSIYDLIIIGAPVWAGLPASPIKTFISQANLKGKKLAIFMTHAGGDKKALEGFKPLLSGNDIVSEMDFANPAKKDSEGVKQIIAEWVKQLG